MLELNKNTDVLNLYIQGSVWIWKKNEYSPNVEGVQSSRRPVLVISNNIFNQWSPVVNCLTITSIIKDSPVHEPVTIDFPSHIQCEQIHTINKGELIKYKGVVPQSTLSNVKDKLRLQLDISTERNYKLLTLIKRDIEEIRIKTDSILSSPTLNQNFCDVLTDIHAFSVQFSGKLNAKSFCSQESPIIANNGIAQHSYVVNTNSSIASTGRTKRKYSDEDILYILDNANTLEDLVKRFNYKNKSSARSTRTYFRKIWFGNSNSNNNV